MERDECGQAVPLLLVFVVFIGVIGLAIAKVGAQAVDETHAQTAADAAALAGVVGGRSAAAEVAQKNGATIESYLVDHDDVQVIVVIGTRRAAARAAPGAPGFAIPGADLSSR